MKKNMLIGIVITALAMGGCAKPAETPPSMDQTATTPVPGPAPASSATGGSETAAPEEEEVWKKVWGPEDAKVKVEAFYPFNEDHQWVQDYAKEISEKYPETVQVTVYDFYSDEGGKVWQERGLSCGAWLINGKIAESQTGTQMLRSEVGGGWKKTELFEAVADAVKKAESGTPAKESASAEQS